MQVVELIPPFVQTHLQGPQQATNPDAMPLADYIAETVEILEADRDVTEVVVDRVRPQRCAEARNEYDEFFKRYNDVVSGRVITHV